MPHKRSREAHIRRTTARIVSQNAYRDRSKSESINVLTQGQVLKKLIDKLPKHRINDLLEYRDMFDRGEIISDSRGEGSQQKMTPGSLSTDSRYTRFTVTSVS